MTDTIAVHDFAQHILNWYDENRRTLPWRGGSAYEVWLSEMMLQQTQVTTVIPYFHRFLERFPTLSLLAQSTLDDVYQVWQGLGYYHRARYLHQAAQQWYALGRDPQSYEEWLSFPGVGPYTAAALTTILLEAPAAAIDGNIKRILQRFFGLNEMRNIERYSRDVLPNHRYGDYTQGLMDFGSMVCTPRTPQCGVCPLSESCQMRLGFWQPPLKPKALKPVRYSHVYICTHEDAIWVMQQTKHRLLKGLWSYPMIETDTQDESWLGSSCTLCGVIKHVFTHFTLYAYVWDTRAVEAQAVLDRWPEGVWMNTDQRAAAGFSRLMRKVEACYINRTIC